MGVPLKNPPVYFTLAQVRFNPILKLPDFLSGIQDSFRQAGFPDFERQQIIAVQMAMQEGQLTPNTVPQDRFLFGNAEKSHTFILDPYGLTLQSTNYGQFETFSGCFMQGLSIVHDAVKLAFTERIGLRYLDRVTPQDGESLEMYLIDQVHGLNSRLGGQPLYSFIEAMNELGKIKLLSRVAIQTGPLVFPPDLQPGNLVVEQRLASYIGKYAILDNDGFVLGREAFSGEAVAAHLDEIHKVIGEAFKATVTQHALAIWDK